MFPAAPWVPRILISGIPRRIQRRKWGLGRLSLKPVDPQAQDLLSHREEGDGRNSRSEESAEGSPRLRQMAYRKKTQEVYVWAAQYRYNRRHRLNGDGDNGG